MVISNLKYRIELAKLIPLDPLVVSSFLLRERLQEYVIIADEFDFLRLDVWVSESEDREWLKGGREQCLYLLQRDGICYLTYNELYSGGGWGYVTSRGLVAYSNTGAWTRVIFNLEDGLEMTEDELENARQKYTEAKEKSEKEAKERARIERRNRYVPDTPRKSAYYYNNNGRLCFKSPSYTHQMNCTRTGYKEHIV